MTVALAGAGGAVREIFGRALSGEGTRWRRFAPISATVIDRRYITDSPA
jgi:hypothetical protein